MAWLRASNSVTLQNFVDSVRAKTRTAASGH
jgi:hypothetical protein